MSRLNLIVESLLRDIIEAQHAANCHAAGLARQYGKHGGVRGFQLPSAQIGSLEFDLKYAVTGTSGVEERQVLDAEQCSLFPAGTGGAGACVCHPFHCDGRGALQSPGG